MPDVHVLRQVLGRPGLWLGLAGLLFIASSAGKMMQFPEFLRALAGYRLVPGGLLMPGGIALIAAELAIGLGLLLPKTQRPCARAGSALLILFSIVIAISLVNHLNLDCGCSLPFETNSKISWLLVGRNLGLAFLIMG